MAALRRVISLWSVATLLAWVGAAEGAGWYLMFPPADQYNAARQAGLRGWRQSQSYDTTAECQREIDLAQRDGERILRAGPFKNDPAALASVRRLSETRLQSDMEAQGMPSWLIETVVLYRNMAAAQCIASDDPRLAREAHPTRRTPEPSARRLPCRRGGRPRSSHFLLHPDRERLFPHPLMLQVAEIDGTLKPVPGVRGNDRPGRGEPGSDVVAVGGRGPGDDRGGTPRLLQPAPGRDVPAA